MNVYELDENWVLSSPGEDGIELSLEGCKYVFLLSGENDRGIVVSLEGSDFVIDRGKWDGREVSRPEETIFIEDTTRRTVITP